MSISCQIPLQLKITSGAPFAYYNFDADLNDIDNPYQLDLSITDQSGTYSFTPGKISNALQPTEMLQLDNTYSPLPLTWELDKDSSGTQGVGFGIRVWFRMDDFLVAPATEIHNTSYIRLSSLNPFGAWAIGIDRIGAAFFVSKPGDFGYDYTTAGIPVTVFDGGWHMIVCTYDYVNDLVKIRLDDNPTITTVATSKILWDDALDFFRIRIEGVATVDPTWGPITFYTACDEVAVYKNVVLSDAIMDAEWNGGAGRTWNGVAWV